MATRKLDLQKFIDSVPEDLRRQYFEKKEEDLGTKIALKDFQTGTIVDYLDTQSEEDVQSQIRQDIIQMNDLCEKSMNILVQALNRYGVERTGREKREELAIIAFLVHKNVFEYAHDQYCLLNSSSKISEHNMTANGFVLSDEKKRAFEIKIKEFFAKLEKGKGGKIRFYDEPEKLMIAIERGSYKQSLPVWDDDDKMDRVVIRRFRRAKEDILEYLKTEGKLYIKTSYKKDREFYLETFADVILTDRTQTTRSDRDESFDLSPIQKDNFRFQLNETVQAISILEIKMLPNTSTSPEISIKSPDVFQTLKADYPQIKLGAGEITHIKMRFELRIDGKRKKVTFEINPPNSTDLNTKKYADIIRAYLKKIGIKKDVKIPATAIREKSTAVV